MDSITGFSTAYSSLNILMLGYQPKPTIKDVYTWSSLNTPLPSGYSIDEYSLRLGLFGQDLTLFNQACK